MKEALRKSRNTASDLMYIIIADLKQKKTYHATVIEEDPIPMKTKIYLQAQIQMGNSIHLLLKTRNILVRYN